MFPLWGLFVIGSPSLDHHDFWFYLSGLRVWNAWDVHINIVGKPDKNNVEKLTENQELISDYGLIIHPIFYS